MLGLVVRFFFRPAALLGQLVPENAFFSIQQYCRTSWYHIQPEHEPTEISLSLSCKIFLELNLWWACCTSLARVVVVQAVFRGSLQRARYARLRVAAKGRPLRYYALRIQVRPLLCFRRTMVPPRQVHVVKPTTRQTAHIELVSPFVSSPPRVLRKQFPCIAEPHNTCRPISAAHPNREPLFFPPEWNGAVRWPHLFPRVFFSFGRSLLHLCCFR